ncbi:MAG: PEP-CTERM sorting domain-containing protein [Gammaproteobacteria bacterium]|nr:PEP-CTERM sorting domain-containing protein [Gammaproteobacteria bacterium]
MNNLSKLSLALAATLAAGPATANNVFLDLTPFGGGFEVSPPNTADANDTTGVFNEFGFSQILATSVYDFSDSSVFGSFYDTNIIGNNATANTLAYAGVPTSGTALDGVSTVNLVNPDCSAGQCDLDALSPLVPPLGSDSEGFLQSWDLQVEYTFFGNLTAAGPQYNSGTFDVFFNDFSVPGLNDVLAFSGALTGSDVQLSNLDLFFDITFAVDDFLWIEDSSAPGTFRDAADVIAGGGNLPTLTLDTNVNPPIPTTNQLLAVVDAGGNTNAIRQTTLDGSITAAVPEPSTLALFGAALIGFGAYAKRRRS